MEFSGDAGAFLLLGMNQAPAQAVQGFFGRLPLRDVDRRADIAAEGSIDFKSGRPIVNDPAELTVEPPQPVFHFESGARIKRRRVGSDATLNILWMYANDPPFSQFLFHGPAREAQPTLIEKGAKFVRAGHPDENGSRVCNQAKSFFALAQNCLTCEDSLHGTFTLQSVPEYIPKTRTRFNKSSVQSTRRLVLMNDMAPSI